MRIADVPLQMFDLSLNLNVGFNLWEFWAYYWHSDVKFLFYLQHWVFWWIEVFLRCLMEGASRKLNELQFTCSSLVNGLSAFAQCTFTSNFVSKFAHFLFIILHNLMSKSDLCFQVGVLYIWPDWHGFVIYFRSFALMVMPITRGMLVLIGNVI